MKIPGFAKIAGITALFCVAAVASHAQTFTTLHSFDVSDGYDPVYGTLVQGTDGNFYGTTSFGGNPDGTGGCADPDGCGPAFEITSAGKLTTFYKFCSQANCTDGQSPFRAALVQASNGNLYGATSEVPPVSGGTIFGINHAGTLSTLFSFCFKPTCPIGFSLNTMVQAPNGAIYGTTFSGGAHKVGTFFAFLPGGKFATLHSFTGLAKVVVPAHRYWPATAISTEQPAAAELIRMGRLTKSPLRVR